MMEGAFFVSKNELISWINDLLQIHITKVEQMASGAAYCQIMDIMYPGSVAMSKINWLAQYDHEFVVNYKLLQAAFDKNNIQKHIDVEKLIKAKYQDNLEFFQWFKRFFDLNCGNSGEYNAMDRRRGAKTPWDSSDKKEARNRSSDKRLQPTSPKLLSPRGPSPGLKIPTSPSQVKSSSTHNDRNEKILNEKIEKLENEINELKEVVVMSEKEKDFYFSKLRIIENYCDFHDLKQSEYLMDIQKILFSSESDKVTLNDNGSITLGFN